MSRKPGGVPLVMSDDDECLTDAESVLARYRDAELVSDEAELLRGCLSTLVYIAQKLA